MADIKASVGDHYELCPLSPVCELMNDLSPINVSYKVMKKLGTCVNLWLGVALNLIKFISLLTSKPSNLTRLVVLTTFQSERILTSPSSALSCEFRPQEHLLVLFRFLTHSQD